MDLRVRGVQEAKAMNDDIEQRRTGKLPSGELEQPCILTVPTPELIKQQQEEKDEQLTKAKMKQLVCDPELHSALFQAVCRIHDILCRSFHSKCDGLATLSKQCWSHIEV
jgi:hypothetical protein